MRYIQNFSLNFASETIVKQTSKQKQKNYSWLKKTHAVKEGMIHMAEVGEVRLGN